MSGICAIWRRDRAERLAPSLASLAMGLYANVAERATQECDQFVGIGASAKFQEQQIYRDGNFLLACDADLLNEQDLGESIGWGSGKLKTGGTAALLLSLYEKFGTGFADKLRGGFSFVLWDRRERRLAAGIDGFGIKRLAYYQDKNVLMIASRVDALARTGEIGLDINSRAIVNVLNFSANLAPETIFRQVQRLIPGAILHASDRGTRVEKYWDMRYGVGDDSSVSRLSQKLESVVQESVECHAKSDRLAGMGAFLSGGTDSSTVVGMMTRVTGAPVKSFSIGFQEQPFNELGYAELAAKKFGSEHHTYLVGPGDCFEALPKIIGCFDEPFGNSSAIPTYFCARLAAQNGVQALLAGDGGDELFGGNTRYATDKVFEIYRQVPGIVRKGLIEPVLGFLPNKGALLRKTNGYVRRANITGVARMLSFQFLQTHAYGDIFEQDFVQALGGYTIVDIPAAHYAEAPASNHLDRLLYVDLKITLADNDLPKVTCVSELAGIRTRFPFLDRSVAEFSGRIPARLKLKGFEKRFLFKRAFRDLLPVEIIKKKKHGFGIPVANWMKSDKRMRELSRDTLLSTRAFGRGYFRRQFVEELFRRHDEDSSTFYGDTLWTFLALELWHRQLVDEPAKVMA
ncbi:MAG: asparagine synthase-related protein [Bryobacteraceae bacterium]